MPRIGTHCGLAALTLLTVGWLACLAPAADKRPELRQRVLALNDITGNDPIEGQIKLLQADPAGTKQLLAEAKKLAKDKDQPLSYTAEFILARAGHELKDYDAAEKFYSASMKQAAKLGSVQKVTLAMRYLITLYYENKKYDECARACQEFLQVPGDESVNRMKLAVIELMIQSLAKEGKFDEALKMTDNLAKLEKGEGWWSLSLRGLVEREAGKYADAVKTYEEVIKRVEGDKDLKQAEKDRYVDRNRYILSNVYIDLNQVDKASAMLKALLDKKPDDPTYNNDLGYIWADHDMHLDEAEKLIRKAIALDRKERKADPELTPDEDKDNPAYLDSLGWVLYKKKQYAEAKKYLLQAAGDKDAQDIEIYSHLGDIHQALGEKAAALEAWKKAVQFAKQNKRDQAKKAEVEKKVQAAEDKEK